MRNARGKLQARMEDPPLPNPLSLLCTHTHTHTDNHPPTPIQPMCKHSYSLVGQTVVQTAYQQWFVLSLPSCYQPWPIYFSIAVPSFITPSSSFSMVLSLSISFSTIFPLKLSFSLSLSLSLSLCLLPSVSAPLILPTVFLFKHY